MSELRPTAPASRPASARPRAGAANDEHGHEPPPEVDPPSDAEIGAVRDHLASLPVGPDGELGRSPELGVVLARAPGSGPDAAYAAAPDWSDTTWPDDLDRVAEHLSASATWPSLLVAEGVDRPGDLAAHLGGRGWTRVTRERVLWVGHASVVPHLDPLLRIEALQPRSVELHERIEREIFGIDPVEAERRRRHVLAGLEAGTVRGWIVWLDEEPVAVARLSQGDGVAALQGIGVVSARRNQGFGRLITTIATRAAMAIGNRIVWLSVDPDEAAAMRVYTRLGYAPLFDWSRWLLTDDRRRRR